MAQWCSKIALDAAAAWLDPKYVKMYTIREHIEFIDGDGVKLNDICFGESGKYPCRPTNKLDLFPLYGFLFFSPRFHLLRYRSLTLGLYDK